VVGDEHYVVNVELTSTSFFTDARWVWCEIDYTMPSYDKAY